MKKSEVMLEPGVLGCYRITAFSSSCLSSSSSFEGRTKIVVRKSRRDAYSSNKQTLNLDICLAF